MISNVENIDCMEGMKGFPDKFFDLAVVDPPYGIGEDGSKNHSRSKLAVSKNYKGFHGGDFEAPQQSYFDELFRVSKNQIIWGANHFISKIPFNSSCWIVWDKVNGKNDFADCELAWTSFLSAVRMLRFMWHGFMQGIDYNGKMNGNKSLNENRIHPTQKPIALYKWLLQNYAKPGDKILDTHLGSQSSRIAAYKLGFDFWGYEIDQDYFKQGCERFEKAIAEPLFDVKHYTQSNIFKSE